MLDPRSPHTGFHAYDPNYDPIIDGVDEEARDYAPTYWIATAGPPPEDDGPLSGEAVADTVVIGSGYTGLNCAIALARDQSANVVVLESNRAAWGCSTRNGGQAQISTGRLKRSGWVKRYGVEIARGLHAEVSDGFAYFERMIVEAKIDCQPQAGGHYYIAHRPAMVASLRQEAETFRSVFGYGARFIERDELQAEHVNDREAHGALWEPDGTGIHAGRLAFGYQRHARVLGVRIHVASPVIGWSRDGDRFRVRTPNGVVRTRNVAIATGGYTAPKMDGTVSGRLLPVISNSIVTRPLDETELAEIGVHVRSPLTDTRTLRNYYRLLPDGRMQIGSRGAISGRDADDKRHEAALRLALARKFPALDGIALDHSWWGFVDVSHDMMPRIVQPDAEQRIFYALGYGGNGVMYSAQAGRRLAQLVAGRGPELPKLPIFEGALPHYGPLTPFRRLGQRLMYRWYQYRDERV